VVAFPNDDLENTSSAAITILDWRSSPNGWFWGDEIMLVFTRFRPAYQTIDKTWGKMTEIEHNYMVTNQGDASK
jgi:hypothetical protein